MKYILTIILSLLLVVPINAQMQNSSVGDQKNGVAQEKIEEGSMGMPKRDNLRKNLQNTVEERRLKVKKHVQNRLSNMVQKHVNRLQKRFDMYNTRLSAVIAKMESNDVITANPKAVTTLEKAKQDLQDANTTATKTLEELRKLQASETIDIASLKQVKTLANQTVNMYKQVHTDLISIINLVRSSNHEK